MLIYTLLFTCVGQNPEDNYYIPMFGKWLAHLIYHGGLDGSDSVIVLIDDITFGFLEGDKNLWKIIAGLSFPLQFHKMYQPFSIIEGICEKYLRASEICSRSTTNLYLDLRILVLKPLKSLYSSLEYSSMKDSLLVQGDNSNFHHIDYGGSLIKTDYNLCGLTSGVFAFIINSEVLQFFDFVVKGCLECSAICLADPLICLADQSYFNKYVYLAFRETTILSLGIQIISDTSNFRQQELVLPPPPQEQEQEQEGQSA